MSTEEKPVDLIPMVRSFIKMSSIMAAADNVTYSKYNKFKLKKNLHEFVDIFETSSEPFFQEFMKDSPEALNDAIVSFTNIFDKIHMKTSEWSSLFVLMCTLMSSINDLNEVEKPNVLTIMLKSKAQRVIDSISSQYASLKEIIDANGNDYRAFVFELDQLGKSMFTNNLS